MKLCYKIWIDQDGKAFGSGPYHILSEVEKSKSLNKAAKELNISYSKAWKIINMVEKRLGFKFLNRETGGNYGGGSYLTEEGQEFMKNYSQFMKEADEKLNNLFLQYFGNK